MTPDSLTFVARAVAAFARDRKAATAVEYGLMLALVVLALMTALVGLGGETKLTWNSILTRITTATGR